MNIKKIIKEEMDDFGWIQDTSENPCDMYNPCVGMKWQAKAVNGDDEWMYEVYEIISMDSKYMAVKWWDDYVNGYVTEEHYLMSSYERLVNENSVKVVD